MPISDLLFVAGTVFAASIVRALFGFATALIVVPLFALRFGVATASPTFAIVSVFLSVAMLSRKKVRIDRKSMAGLLTSALAGMVPGILILRSLPNRTLSLGLAGFILVSVGLMLLQRRVTGRRQESTAPLSPWWAIPYGLVSGAIMGAYVAGGPPIALYGTRKGWAPEEFRDNLQVFFLVASPLLIIQYAILGAIDREILIMAAVAVPPALAAVYIGRKIAPRIPQERFFGIVLLLLVAIAVSLVVRAV